MQNIIKSNQFYLCVIKGMFLNCPILQETGGNYDECKGSFQK